ncbi:MAG: hypothetical protein R6V83_10905 [Candidatus Thorarchaeota archaeon]
MTTKGLKEVSEIHHLGFVDVLDIHCRYSWFRKVYVSSIDGKMANIF